MQKGYILEGEEANALNGTIERQRTELASALGMFAIEFATMEHWFDEAIRHLLGLDRMPGAMLTGAILNVSTRLDIFEALANELPMDDDIRKDLIAQHKKIGRLNSQRNWLLHNQWVGTSIKSDDPIERHYKGKIDRRDRKWKSRGFSIAEIEQLSNECREVVRGFAVSFHRIPNNRLKEGLPEDPLEG